MKDAIREDIEQMLHSGAHSLAGRTYDQDMLASTIVWMVNDRPTDEGLLQRLYVDSGLLEWDKEQIMSKDWVKVTRSLSNVGHMRLDIAPEVAPILHHENNEVRLTALWALTLCGRKRLLGNIEDIFECSSRWSYRLIVNILYPTHIKSGSLSGMIRSNDRDYRKAASTLLGWRGNIGAIKPLEVLCYDGVKDVRREATIAVGRIGGHRAKNLLLSKLEDPDPQVRIAAIQGIEGIRCNGCISLIRELMMDPVFEVRFQASKSLAAMGVEASGPIWGADNTSLGMPKGFA